MPRTPLRVGSGAPRAAMSVLSLLLACATAQAHPPKEGPPARSRQFGVRERAEVERPETTSDPRACRPLGAQTADRVALIMGNGGYRGLGQLANPVNDARAMAGALRDLGWHVLLGLDLGIAQMRGCVGRFEDLAAASKAAVVFYAGHGIEVKGENFLVSVDQPVQDPRRRSLGLHRLLEASKGADVRLVILDACRNNPFREHEGRVRGQSAADAGGWHAIETSVGTLVAYGTAPGHVALDAALTKDIGPNAPFTHALLENIPVPGLEMAELMRRVTRRVRELTDNRQRPWLSASYTQGFYFVPPQAGVAAEFTPDPVPPADVVGWLQAGKEAYDAKKYSKALRPLERAARAGHPEAEYTLAKIYIKGEGGVREDRVKAAYWLELAAGRGHAAAQYLLGRFHAAGFGGVTKSDHKAAEYFERSAQQGFPPAMAKLGLLYEVGRGRPRDRAQAVRWYAQARTYGDKAGFEALQRLAEEGDAAAQKALRK